ncbi:MAG: TolC family protein [Saprospiraceae bacterium]|nr:TolC family protein [Saprospiraceae bacterium]
MRLILISSSFALPLTILLSQSEMELSLVKALEEGLSNRLELQIQSIDQQIADQANAKIKAHRLPQIESSADFRINTQLQSTVLPFDISGQNPEGTSTVRFGTRFQNNIGLGLNQIISDPSKKIEWEINVNRAQIQQQRAKETRLKLQLAICQAYYAAVYYLEKLEIAEQALERAQLNQLTGQIQWQQGVLLENEWLRLQVAATNSQLEMERSKDQFYLSMLQLKNEIYLDPQITVSLSDNLKTLETRIQLQNARASSARPEIERLELEEKEASMQGRLILARNKMVVNAYANYGLLHLNDQFNPVASNTWFPSCSIRCPRTIVIAQEEKSHSSTNPISNCTGRGTSPGAS